MTERKLIMTSTSLIQELRERTGGGLLECKRALEATNDDVDAAADLMRKSGKAKADKKASRIASEGIVCAACTDDDKFCLLLEVNCETDFVARGGDFGRFVETVVKVGLDARVSDLASLMALPVDSSGKTVADLREELITKIGENINVRRLKLVAAAQGGVLGLYLHGKRMGAVVSLSTYQKELAREIAMHVVASRPVAIGADQIPENIIIAEKEIYMAQGMESGKPVEIIERMVKGRLQKFIDSLALLNQPFVKNEEVLIGELLKLNGSQVLEFVRYELGEGIEKEKGDFAAEVMAQLEDKK